jgi:hypothetical protein
MLRWLLIIPIVIALAVPLYNTMEPSFIGVPFFYWFQLLLVPASALVTLLIYLAEGRR